MRFREGITQKSVLCETVDLKLKKSVDHLQLTKVIGRRDGPVPDKQYVKALKKFARGIIKSFSHTSDKEKLRRYVDNHFVIGDVFALGIPMSILELISLGINEFSKKDNKIFRLFTIFRDVITIGFLMRSMKRHVITNPSSK
jgi:hypothetical protein